MAITRIASRSSTMTNVARKIFREAGTRLPSSDNTPSANAMSVAIGIPHPEMITTFELNKKYIPVGRNIPPNAAKIDIEALPGEDNSPSMILRLISRPMSQKNMAIRPSFIH